MAEWVELDECANEGIYCPECHKKIYTLDFAKKVKVKFCPNCGADMRQPQAEIQCGHSTEEIEKSFMEDVETVKEQLPNGDLISRQAVDVLVDELARAISDERCCMSRGRSTATIMQDILDLPSVNPAPSGDAVSRQAVLNNLCNSCTNIGCEFQSGIVRTECAFYMPPHIESDNCGNYVVIPSVKPQEPKTGHWIMTGDYYTGAYGDIDYVECSCCHEYSLEEGDYCPNCGAKMN